jgi:hypothetical protein
LGIVLLGLTPFPGGHHTQFENATVGAEAVNV